MKARMWAALGVVAWVVWGAEGAVLQVPADHATIQAAIDAASAGDTILVDAGEDTLGDPSPWFEGSITIGKPLTLSWNRTMGAGGGYIRPVIQGRPGTGAAVTIRDAADVRLIGFRIRHSERAGVLVSGARNVTIRDCAIEGASYGVLFDPRPARACRDARLFNNRFEQNRLCGVAMSWSHAGVLEIAHNRFRGCGIGFLGFAGSWGGAGDGRWSICDNEIAESRTTGLWIEGPRARSVEVLRNRIHDNEHSLVLEDADGVVFANNTVDFNGLGMAFVTRRGMGKTCWIVNNAIANNGGDAITAWFAGGRTEAVLYNNTVCVNDGKGIRAEGGPLRGRIGWNNVWRNAGGDYAGRLPNLTGRWGNISADPLFIRDDGSEERTYLLKDGSPCANAGSPLPRFRNHDGTRNDMGAFGGPARDPTWGWAWAHKRSTRIYSDHGRIEMAETISTPVGARIGRANPFNGGLWLMLHEGWTTGIVAAVDGAGVESARIPGFRYPDSLPQNTELAVDPRDGSCWVAEVTKWSSPTGRLTRWALDGTQLAELWIPGLRDVEVVRADGAIAVLADGVESESNGRLEFRDAQGGLLRAIPLEMTSTCGLGINPRDSTLTVATDGRWLRFSLDPLGERIFDGAWDARAHWSSCVLVDPTSGNTLVTTFAEDDTGTSLTRSSGEVIRYYDIQSGNDSPLLDSHSDVERAGGFFVGPGWWLDEESGKWMDRIAVLDSEMAEIVGHIDLRAGGVSFLRNPY